MPLERISPWLQDAVVNSEDARFYLHHGVDEVELNLALQRAMDEGHLGRGASTLTQQLAKNLWLGEDRSLLRKAKEYVLAERLEKLGKDRILELYLNVVEWGNGIYGAEAASRTWFGKPAAALSPEESAVLAAMLPAPRKRNPRKPSHRLRVRALRCSWSCRCRSRRSTSSFVMRRWMRRRSTSSLVSPGPRVPMPPACCDSPAVAPLRSRGRR